MALGVVHGPKCRQKTGASRSIRSHAITLTVVREYSDKPSRTYKFSRAQHNPRLSDQLSVRRVLLPMPTARGRDTRWKPWGLGIVGMRDSRPWRGSNNGPLPRAGAGIPALAADLSASATEWQADKRGPR